jgi:hypothetical protein
MLHACELWPQSPVPDNRYVLRARARYVTGYPYVPRDEKDRPRVAQGAIYVGTDALAFRFCSEKNNETADPFAQGIAGSVDNSLCEEHCGAKTCQEVRIPYQRMKLLARGRAVGMGGTSEDVQAASAGLAIGGIIASVATGGTVEKGLIGATVAVAATGFALHEIALKRSNYMSIFFAPAHQTDAALPCAGPAPAPSPPNPAAAKPAGAQPPASPPSLFADANGCNVAILQIFNSHKYWDISVILNSRTGKQFVAQSAEQK